MRGVDITDKKFGTLTAIKRLFPNINRMSQWLCICECGKECIKSVSHLNAGDIKSCGCLNNPNEKQYLEILKERLLSKRKIKANGCWEWTGALAQGYVLIHLRNNNFTKAHRLSWELFRGPIPKGLCVCHHCDNPKCFNPDHLWVGTHADNMKDKDRKGRGNKGRKLKRRQL